MPDEMISPRVLHALQAAPRAEFLPDAVRPLAHIDAPLPIGKNQTNSQPTTVAIMLSLLDVREGDSVLDVGAGSGWTTAILSALAGSSGRVIGVERHASLVESARKALAYHRERTVNEREPGDLANAEIHVAIPGVLGWPDSAPFDRILVSAMAEDIPHQLVDQLAEGGILVVPVAGTMLRIQKTGSRPTITRHGRFVFVPLVEE